MKAKNIASVSHVYIEYKFNFYFPQRLGESEHSFHCILFVCGKVVYTVFINDLRCMLQKRSKYNKKQIKVYLKNE